MKDRNPKSRLEDILAALRSESLDPNEEAAAGARAWSRIESAVNGPEADVAHIRSCTDVRLLLPAYRSGKLAPARALLVQDHLRDCVGCRRYSQGENADSGAASWRPEAPAVAAWNWRGLAVAAAILAVAAVTTFGLLGYFATPAGARATVQSAEGMIYVVSRAGDKQLATGAQIAEGETIRTGPGGHAYLRLLDGSVVELSERTEVGVSASRHDTTVLLDGGRLIVQAAKRTKGHLYVKTRDLRVAVTGTIFSVNSGLKGSRVAVIEGAVQVTGLTGDSLLQPGQETDTAGSSGYVPVAEEISWSQDLDKHLALLAEFAKLQKKITDNVQVPGPRSQSVILPMMPLDTLLYVSVPNLGEALAQANQIFQQQLQESAVLKQWWDQKNTAEKQANFSQMIERIRQLSHYIGDEIVFAGVGIHGPNGGIAIVAKITDSGLLSFLQAEAVRMNAEAGSGAPVMVLEPQQVATLAPAPGEHHLYMLVRPDFLVVSPSVTGIQRMNMQLDAGASGFANSDFGQAIQHSYAHGIGLLIAANLQAMTANSTPKPGFQAAGFGNVHYLIMEHREVNGRPENRAALDFNGPRAGIPSWLGAPSPIRSLEYISPNASIAFAGISKSPAAMLDDVLAMAQSQTSGSTPQSRLDELQRETGVNVRDEIAGSLGTDFAIALDGPPLPTPAWKAVLEVTNSGQLQGAIERVIAAANQKLAANKRPPITLTRDDSSTPVFYSITGDNAMKQIHYTYVDGYMVVGPTRALVAEAIQVHDSGVTLASSQSFHDLLPTDGRPDVSALFYQNLQPILGPLSGTLSSTQMQSLQEIAANSKPSAIVAYGDAQQIEVASTAQFPNLNSLTFGALLGKKGGTMLQPVP